MKQKNYTIYLKPNITYETQGRHFKIFAPTAVNHRINASSAPQKFTMKQNKPP